MNYISSSMPKSPATKRIEVHLMPEVIEAIKKLADKENRSLKNYIETILIEVSKVKQKK